jgi:hypothetical protein
MMRRSVVALVALVAVSISACVIFTGSTDGYNLAPADSGASSSTDAAAEASPGLTLGCVSSSDCADAGGGGGAVCCLTATSLSSASAACQPAPCGGTFNVQLCSANTECGSQTCVLQRCTFSGAPVTLRACGTILTCSAL